MKAAAITLNQSVARKAIAWLRAERSGYMDRLQGETAGQRIRYHFWQPGRGYDRNMDNPKTIAAAIAYLHNNPIRRVLVQIAKYWYWSSARYYVGLDGVKLVLDRIAP